MEPFPDFVFGILGLTAISFVGFSSYSLLRITGFISAYKAKILCSSVFISKRDQKAVEVEDLADYRLARADIDFERQEVTASILGIAKHRTIFREGLGSTSVIGIVEKKLRKQSASFPGAPQKEVSWPAGDRLPPEARQLDVDVPKLTMVIDKVYSDTDPKRSKRTRAVLVVHKGQIIAECYGEGFSQDTPMPGWSLTNSITNALIGILVGKGKVSIHQSTLLPEWHKSGDSRSRITLDHLLRMTSGLESRDRRHWWQLGDVNIDLYMSFDAADRAIKRTVMAEPGSRWEYHNGSSNIISRLIRNEIEGTQTDYFAFPRKALFHPIGMYSAILEPDASGVFVGSSFMYATARDWARFGLLYLHDGVWQGKRILPEGWVTYSTTPTPHAPWYGANFWTNGCNPSEDDVRPYPSLPPDAFFALGVFGQYIVIIPSHKIVIVRLGFDEPLPRNDWDLEPFVAKVLEAVSK